MVPLIILSYHAFTYAELPDSYVAGFTYLTALYISLIGAGLLTIILTTILLHKPTLYPIIRLLYKDIDGTDILMLSMIISVSLASALSVSPIAPLWITSSIYLLYKRYSAKIDGLTDLLNDFAHMSRETSHEYAIQGMMAKGYGKYLDAQLSMAWKSYNEEGTYNVDDPNLKPFFTAVSEAGDDYKDAISRYVVNVTSLFNIDKYVYDQYKASNPKPYLQYTILFLIFLPLIYSSGYILSYIAIPIFAIFRVIGNLSSPYNMNASNFSWEDFWSEFGGITPSLPFPPLSLDIYNLIGLVSSLIIILLGSLESYSKRDPDPKNLIVYAAAIILFDSSIKVLGALLSGLAGI
jgi:hypothetical protein